VYADWIDACDAVAKEAAAGKAQTARSSNRMGRVETQREDEDDDQPDADDLGFVEQDDLDAEGEYEG
jgi:hypothetical protein